MSLVNELVKGLLPEEEKKQTTAVYAGGFKPPTSGHFEVVEQALKENPEIDEFIIFVGNKERNGISQTESLLIWEIYNNYLPFKVKIEPTSIPPIKAVYDFAKNHPTREVLWVIGAREGNEEDFKDITSRTKSISKYPNLELRTIVTSGGVSGTAARNASKVSFDKFDKFMPGMLNPEEKQEVFDLVSGKVLENKPQDGKSTPYGSGYKKLKENASYSQHIDIIEKIADLTNYMVENGLNIEPLPTLEFIDGDSENAKDFFGKTAYYDPNNQHIVLYTEGRHPKDIVRSYSHEMIHHIQYLEDRLGDIAGTDTTSDSHLDKLEQEANLRGTMTFRNWTDSLQEGKKKDPFGLLAYAQELGRLREEESKYKVYLDMDGVLADFDQRFRDLSGMAPKDFENKYGRKAFWDLIDEENKVKFWVGIPTMPGAADLVSAVKDYDYELLTSPSAKKQSYLGKILWVKNHTGDVFPSKPRINFKKAKEKHLVKPQLAKTDILIDDREDTIGRWNAAGGTGIVYKNISQVLNDLGKLGL